MEISPENLNKLKGWKYEEYQNLAKKDFDGKKSKIFAFIVFHFLLCLVFSLVYILITNEIVNNWGSIILYTFLIGCLFPPCWLVSGVIIEVVGLEKLYTRIYQHFSHKTKDYLRLKELKKEFIPIEKRIEVEAVAILSEIDKPARDRLAENSHLNSFLKSKRKSNLYLREIEKVEKNCQFNDQALDIVEENICYIKFDTERRKYFLTLQNDLRNQYRNFTGLLLRLGISDRRKKSISSNRFITTKVQEAKFNHLSRKIENLSDRIKKIGQPQKESTFSQKVETDKNSFNPSSSNEPIILKIKDIYTVNKTDNKEINKGINLDKVEFKDFEESENEDFIKIHENKINEKQSQLEFDFEQPNINLRTLDDIPTQRKTAKYERIIKLTPTFYQEIANKKIEIGMCGELLVMEYEKQKLSLDEVSVKDKLHHSSLTNDALGYDIRSFKNGEVIYIEVKTTTGSFWSNLYFTQNEFNKMNEFGDKYYLYRICNFDMETKLGELFIFEGKEMIESYFNFKSKVYVLTQKKS